MSGLVRDNGVGVETARKGSLVKVEWEVEVDAVKDCERRSSIVGGAMPSSVCNQSICINVADNC